MHPHPGVNVELIRAYSLYTVRDKQLAAARELERIAAELQQIADEIRESA